MNSTSLNARLVRICLLAALIAALGLLPRVDLPIAAGVPITAQTLGVMLAGVALGARDGALAVVLMIFVTALGLPFLAGGRGGLGIFVSPTTGFLLGWIPGAYLTGLIAGHTGSVTRIWAGCVLGGVVAIYACGIAWLHLYAGLDVKAAALATLIFLPGDIIKAAIATAAARYFRRFKTPAP